MRVTFRVHGQVQGVGFRRFAAREAQALGLAGWVANASDGTVCGEAEGASAELAALRIVQPPRLLRVRRCTRRTTSGSA